jgi:two-component system sensor histidine kinase PilS (NtrC family)
MKQRKDSQTSNYSDTKNKIRWLLILRLVILSFLLIATIVVQQKRGILPDYLNLIYSFILISSLFTLISLAWLKRSKNDIAFGYNQLIWDILFVTAIIYLTGGYRSIFSFLYILSIINASIILLRFGSFIIASISGILYSALLLLENYKVIKYVTALAPDNISLFPFPVKSADIYLRISINFAAFYVVAGLSSYLAEQLKKTGDELKEFQIDYEELEAINKNIVQSINSGLITINMDNFITFLNHAAEDLTGYSLAKAHNMHINDIFKDIDFNKTNGQTSTGRLELKYQKNGDEELFLGLSLSNLKDTKGKDVGKILIFQDLTKIKEMEERLMVNDKLAAVGKMAAGIAHEIRNPMASISASIQMLKQEMVLEESNKKLMEIVLRESDRLNSLITDLLLFAKPKKSAKEVVTLSPIMNDTIDLLVHSPTYNPDIDIIKEIDDNLTIKADSNQLKQVFSNLFLNSLEAMSNGGGELKLTIKKNRTENKNIEYAEIIVKDSGAGVPEKILDRMYDPFFTTKEQGTGLGLAIVYRIIENHNGQIYLNTDTDKGAEFHILLPINM